MRFVRGEAVQAGGSVGVWLAHCAGIVVVFAEESMGGADSGDDMLSFYPIVFCEQFSTGEISSSVGVFWNDRCAVHDDGKRTM